jgi:hypothetical protein
MPEMACETAEGDNLPQEELLGYDIKIRREGSTVPPVPGNDNLAHGPSDFAAVPAPPTTAEKLKTLIENRKAPYPPSTGASRLRQHKERGIGEVGNLVTDKTHAMGDEMHAVAMGRVSQSLLAYALDIPA